MANQLCAADAIQESDLFRSCFDRMVNVRHPLALVTAVTPSDALIATIGHTSPQNPEGPSSLAHKAGAWALLLEVHRPPLQRIGVGALAGEPVLSVLLLRNGVSDALAPRA